jgi:hypothetical protein
MVPAAMIRPHRRSVRCLAIVAGVAMRSSLAAAEPAAVPPPFPPDSARVQRRAGVMLGGSIGFGSEALELDLRAGVLVHPRLAVFGDAMGFATGNGGARFLGGGVRVSSDWLFLDARFGQIRVSSSCDFDNPCTSRTAAAGVLGIGLEALHSAHAGLELHVDLIRAFHDTAVEAGLGVSFYL